MQELNAQGQQGMTLLSPAKVNLFFQILSKREDSYHEVASLNQAIDLYDVLTLKRASSDLFTCSDPTLPLDARNLVIKALSLFREKTGTHFPVHIHLDKKIPTQAGLGGGSSNAATTLFGLNRLSGLNISESLLQQWGASLGADVPFFFSLGAAYCTGKGEKVMNVPKLSLTKFWIAKPEFGLSTPEVYAKVKLREQKNDPWMTLTAMLQGKLCSFNDLEEAAFALKPELILYRQTLYSLGFSTVVMTGSGSSFMCFGTPKKLENLYGVSCCYRKGGAWYA